MLFPVLHRVVAIVLDHGEMRVYIVVVLRVVLVVRRRNEQRIKINNFHAEALDVVEFLSHSLQVAAVKTAHVQFVGELIPLPHAFRVPARIKVLVILNVVIGVSVAKPVGEYLIIQRTARPFGYFEVRRKRKIELRLNILHRAKSVITGNVVIVGYDKMIANLLLRALKRKFEIIEIIVRAELCHFMPARTVYNDARL